VKLAKYFGDHLNGLLAKNIKGLIIDLRDNPGGDYKQVCAIAGPAASGRIDCLY